MPNAKVLSEKQAIVESLVDRLQNSCGGVIVDYSGTSVLNDTAMRKEMREAGVEYTVVKNTLMRIATSKVGMTEIDSCLEGPTALATCANDPVAAAKIISKYTGKPDSTIKVKIGFVEGRVIDEAGVKALADLPSREALVAQVLGTMIAPIRGLATVLDANIRGLAIAIKAIADKKSDEAA